jgi:predicted nucleic acid-binding protein
MPVIDASVVVDLIAPDVTPDSAARALFTRWATPAAGAPDLVAPGLMWLEVQSALLFGVRRGRWSGAAADSAAALLERLPIRQLDTDGDRGRAFDLARRYDNWPVYDMLYVAVAERAGDVFVTADQKLRARLGHLGWVKSTAEVMD